MRTKYELTTAALGFLASLAAFGGCQSAPVTSAPISDGGDENQSGTMGAGAQRPLGCNVVCSTAQDCGLAGGLQDASHFQCTSGRCQWQGCKSKTDCTDAFQSANFSCEKEPEAPVSTCVHTCTAAADCAGQGDASDDASHYSCTSGKCQWLGCKSNAECASAFQSSKFICTQENGATVPGCVLACDAPADCVAPGSDGPDASRFSCTNHRCGWLGCTSTQECKTLFHREKVICE